MRYALTVGMQSSPSIPSTMRPIKIGRYALYDAIASGGMATVHIGRLLGPAGFSRTVAIKRLHEHLALDPDFAMMFLDEAMLAARIRHPNVVPTLDVVQTQGQLFVVMEYVQGESMSRLLRISAEQQRFVPPPVVAAIVCAALEGLHAAHEARGDNGEALELVHRDVSPQNILVGIDGIARMVDFGVAKAAGRMQETRAGQMKGKLAYMAPEQVQGKDVDRRTDVFAAGIVLWESLTGRRLYLGDNDAQTLAKVLAAGAPAPSQLVPGLPPAFDAVVGRALAAEPAWRFGSAREMAIALGECGPVAQAFRVAEWVESLAGDGLAGRANRVAEIEYHSASQSRNIAPPTPPLASSVVAPPPLPQRQMPPPPYEAAKFAEPSAGSSSAALPKGATEPGSPPRRLLWVGIAATVGVLATAAATFAIVAALPHGTTRGAPATASAPGPGELVPPSSPPVGASATATAGVVPSSAPVSVDDLPTAPPTTAPPTPPRGPGRAVAPPANNKPGCNPPYVIDSAGVRRYLPQCF
jgi:serine/threonine protein kinase